MNRTVETKRVTYREMTKAIRESRTQRDHSVYDSPELVSVFDPDGNILYASSSHREVVGWSPRHLKGTPVTAFMRPEDRRGFARALDTVTTTQEETRADLDWIDTDGEFRNFYGEIVPMRGDLLHGCYLFVGHYRPAIDLNHLVVQLEQSGRQEQANEFTMIINAVREIRAAEVSFQG